MTRIVRALGITVLSLLLMGLLSQAGQASQITVDFTVAADPEDLVNVGTTGTGTFSFDSSLIPAGGGSLFTERGLGATSIAFSWDGTSWTRANADLFALLFASDGTLLDWGLGGEPGFTTISYSSFPDFMLSTQGFPFLYSDDMTATRGGLFAGQLANWSVEAAHVSEPTSLMLLVLGVMTLCLRHRRPAGAVRERFAA